jgi:hypothetical protein
MAKSLIVDWSLVMIEIQSQRIFKFIWCFSFHFLSDWVELSLHYVRLPNFNTPKKGGIGWAWCMCVSKSSMETKLQFQQKTRFICGNWIPYRVCVNVCVIVVLWLHFGRLNTWQVCFAFDFYEWVLQDESL